MLFYRMDVEFRDGFGRGEPFYSRFVLKTGLLCPGGRRGGGSEGGGEQCYFFRLSCEN